MSSKETSNEKCTPPEADEQNRWLPMEFRDAVSAMPECAMGVVRVVVTLRDGSRIRDVHVVGGLVVKIGNDRSLPFDCGEVTKVEHQR